MIVVQLIVTVSFYANTFVWHRGVSQILSPLTITEGIVLNYNLYFKVIFKEFVQTYKGTDNSMNYRTINAIALEPNENLQDRIRCYSFVTDRIL